MNTFQSGIFVATDFEGTAFSFTNEKGLSSAYEGAIQNVLGEEGIDKLKKIGGRKGRITRQLVEDLLSQNGAQLVINAREYYDTYANTLLDLVPKGKGYGMIWNNDDPRGIITELVARVKLGILLEEEVKPRKGFIEFWNLLKAFKEDGVPIITAVISSGHDELVKEAFKTFELNTPDILVTDDDMRALPLPESTRLKGKPGPIPLWKAWYEMKKLQNQDTSFYTPMLEEKMIFFGDDVNRDGRMAKNASITWGLYQPDEIVSVEIDIKENAFIFKHWDGPANFFVRNIDTIVQKGFKAALQAEARRDVNFYREGSLPPGGCSYLMTRR
jgi:hypothetical protein